jgi:hypothetical protein
MGTRNRRRGPSDCRSGSRIPGSFRQRRSNASALAFRNSSARWTADKSLLRHSLDKAKGPTAVRKMDRLDRSTLSRSGGGSGSGPVVRRSAISIKPSTGRRHCERIDDHCPRCLPGTDHNDNRPADNHQETTHTYETTSLNENRPNCCGQP